MLGKYSEHFHMLQINKKIESELEYRVFNDAGQVITNELNRDYQVNELSKRLGRILEDTLKQEISL